MVLAKIRSAQLVSMLGYNFLFQDVDIVWYKHPLKYFADNDGDETFDIYFQEDGARTTMYEPYDANSGFYFVRNNERTRHFLAAMLMSTDFTLTTQNDQVVFGVLLSEHAVLHGLKVKVFSRYELDFPGGWAFNGISQDGKSHMGKILNETSNSYIFHMSWTSNSADKELYFRQMGLWHVQDQCESKSHDGKLTGSLVPTKCCSPQPVFSCHYRDKPSIRPCSDSPFKDKDGVSWW
jgi:Nucleotide-diphospho-sugar transferase